MLALLLWGTGFLLPRGPLDIPALESVESGTESPEAYQAYLKGQLHFDRWVFTEDHATVFANAIQYLTKAIEIDPEFQAAYSLLSRVYFARARTVTLSDRDYAGARNALEKLIEADDSTILAHEAKAQILWQFERNWEGAETFYNLAKERDPSYQTGTGFLEWMGRRDEVFATLESDLEGANPLSTLRQLAIGYRLLANGVGKREFPFKLGLGSTPF